jgi:TctA family transporter
MDALATHLPGAAALLTLPVNLAALLAGLLAGILGERLVARAGLDPAVPIVLLFPIAALLDPATALLLLASAWSSALVASAPPGRMRRVLALTAGLCVILLLAAGPAIALLSKIGDLEKVALLIVAAATAAVIASGAQSRSWIGATSLIAIGLAVELSPLKPLDGAAVSPRALLLGLLAVGPALVVLLRALAAPEQGQLSGAAQDLTATALPLMLLALPLTGRAALLTLALSEHGLVAGHTLMAQRPRLALGLALALFGIALAASLFMLVARRVPRSNRRPRIDASVSARLCGAIVLLLSLVILQRLGVERSELVVLAVTTVVGGVLHLLGHSPAPLLVGLTIGELMRSALAPALKAGIADLHSALWVAIAALAIIAALSWPWICRAFRDKVS